MSATFVSDKLKASLLQAAIEGKLTKQLPEDGDARDLLKQIEAEKQRLIEEKTIKREKPLPPITKDEIPFAIPDNWVWARLADVCLVITDGAHHTPKYMTNGVPFLSVKNITKYFLDLENTKFISQVEHKKFIKRCYPKRGDLLLSKVGTTGIPLVIDTDIEFSIFVSLALLKIPVQIYNNFLCVAIKSPFAQEQVQSNTKGVGNKNWVLRDIAKMIIPLPPLAEQHRIVEVLETALAKIDKLKAYEIKLHEIDKAFPYKLKASLLQSAIEGKLTKQLPENGDARDLLVQIEAEKQRLIEEKTIKREKPLLPITEDEIPFAIPNNWIWARLGEVTNYGTGKQVEKKKIGENKLIIELEDIEKNSYRLLKKSYDRIAGSNKNVFHKNDVLYGKLRPYLKKCLVIDCDGYCSTEIIPINGYEKIDPNFIKYYITSPYIENMVNNLTYGMDMPRLGTKDAVNLLIPLPPLVEQHRIVAVLETELAKIEKLKKLIEM